jgi:hypothetical protein
MASPAADAANVAIESLVAMESLARRDCIVSSWLELAVSQPLGPFSPKCGAL